MLEVLNLKKTYKTKTGVQQQALKGISLKFESTGLVFILGKSGSGKSTFLNVVSGLDAMDAGEIRICGKSTNDFSPSDYDSYRNTFLGFVFQEYNILNEFTVKENIALALQLQGRKTDEKEIDRLLEIVGLEGLKDRRPNELSGGQKQRIAVARALIKDPQIIFADEPTGNLDSASGEQIFNFLTELAKTKLVVVVSHDRESAFRYGNRIIEMSDGLVISDKKKDKDEVFRDTKVIKAEKNQNCMLLRSKLPANTAWRIATHHIGEKKMKLAITMLLIVLAVSIFGFTEILSGYSMVDSSVATFDKAGVENIILKQGSIGEYFDIFERNNQEITPETIQKLRQKFPDTTFNEYYPLKNIGIAMSGGNYLPTGIIGAVVTDKNGLNELGLPLIGRYPEENEDAVVISDYLLFMCLSKNPELIGLDKLKLALVFAQLDFDENNPEEREAKALLQVLSLQIMQSGKDDSELMNALLRLVLNEDGEPKTKVFNLLWHKVVHAICRTTDSLNISPKLKFTGVVLTNFLDFVDLLQMTRQQQREDERVVTFSHLFYYYFCVFYTNKAFVDNWYSEIVRMGSYILDTRYRLDGEDILKNVNVSYNAKWLQDNPDMVLGENEIIISDIYFQDIFGGLTAFETDKEGDIYDPNSKSYRYTYTYSPYNDSIKLYGEEFHLKIVGVFNFREAYAQNQDEDETNDTYVGSTSRYMIASKTVFDNAVDTMRRVDGLYLRLPESNPAKTALLEFACDTTPGGMLMYHFSAVSNIVYQMSETLFIFKTVFKYLSIVMGLFSVLLLVNFMSGSVMSKKKDIGILRALGARGVDVAKIFVNEASVIGGITTVLSCVGMTLMTLLVNYGIKESALKIFKNDMINNLSLLTFSMPPYIIIVAASAILVYFATIIPAIRISRMLPINAIKQS